MPSQLLDKLVSSLFPHGCRVCNGIVGSVSLGAACAECWSATRIFSDSETLCPKCGRYLRDGRIIGAGDCHRCDLHFYDEAIACGVYEKALSATVIELKKKPHIPMFVRNLLCCRFENAGLDSFDALLPVPISRRRMLERGFNQAEIIARAIAMEFSMQIEINGLTRTKHTEVHRGGMDARARDATVSNVFNVGATANLGGMNLVLLDDVMTSGSTASHCAEELKKNGAETVKVFTIARAL